MGFDFKTLFHRMGHGESGSVQHLSRNAHQPRIASAFKSEHPVADNWRAHGGEMATDLIGAPGFNAYAQKRGLCAGGFAVDAG